MSLRLASVTGLSGSELAQSIEETKNLIEGYHNSIACARSTIANPQFVEHSVAAARAMIARHQQHIDNLLDQQEHGHERIQEMKARIVELEQDLATLFNFAKIVQISELAAKIETDFGEARWDIINQMIAADK